MLDKLSLLALTATILTTGCAATNTCPSPSKAQEFVERSSGLTIKRCRDSSGNVGPYSLMRGKAIHSKGHYNKSGQRIGRWTRYDEQGRLAHDVTYDSKGRVHGLERAYHKGIIQTEVRWEHGQKQGKTCLYHFNAKPKMCGVYVNDKPHGKWPIWDYTGKKLFTNVYQNGFTQRVHQTDKTLGRHYYTREINNGVLISKLYTLDDRLVSHVKQIRCKPNRWCPKSVTIYWTKKSGVFEIKDKPTAIYVYNSTSTYAVEQITKVREEQICSRFLIEDLMKTNIARILNTCRKYSPSSLQSARIQIGVNKDVSIYRAEIVKYSAATSPEMKSCLETNLKRLINTNTKSKVGVCRVPNLVIWSSPKAIDTSFDTSTWPSH